MPLKKGCKVERQIKLRKRESTAPRPPGEPLTPERLVEIARAAARSAAYYEASGCEKLAEACRDFGAKALAKLEELT